MLETVNERAKPKRTTSNTQDTHNSVSFPYLTISKTTNCVNFHKFHIQIGSIIPHSEDERVTTTHTGQKCARLHSPEEQRQN